MKKTIVFFFLFSLLFFAGVLTWRLFPDVFEKVETLLFPSEVVEEAPKQDEASEEEYESQLEELTDANAFLERGENFVVGGYLGLAINDFSRAVEIAPENKVAWERLVSTQMRLRDYSAAEASAKKALETFTNDGDFLAFLGQIKIAQSEFEEAWEIFSAMPDSPQKDFFRGLISAYFQKHDNAKEFLESTKNDSIWGSRAAVLLTAYQEFSLFPEGNPLHERLLLTKAFVDLGYFELAVSSSKEIIKEREDYRDAWLLLGYSYLSLEKYDLAQNILQKARELDPTKPEASFYLGLAKVELGDTEGAISDLTAARENGFSDQKVLSAALGRAYIAGEYYEAARAEYEKIAQLGGGAEKWIEPVRISLDFLSDPESAEAFAQKAVAEFPDSSVAKNLLGWALLEKGDFEGAKTILNEVLARDPSFSAAHYNLGKIAEKQEDLETALMEYKKAYEISPSSAIGEMAAERYNALLMGE